MLLTAGPTPAQHHGNDPGNLDELVGQRVKLGVRDHSFIMVSPARLGLRAVPTPGSDQGQRLAAGWFPSMRARTSGPAAPAKLPPTKAYRWRGAAWGVPPWTDAYEGAQTGIGS